MRKLIPPLNRTLRSEGWRVPHQGGAGWRGLVQITFGEGCVEELEVAENNQLQWMVGEGGCSRHDSLFAEVFRVFSITSAGGGLTGGFWKGARRS